jgi:3-deoxy-D-manno-octulosonic-acid transferase
MLWLYSALLSLAALAALPVALFLSLRDPDLRRHWGERLGWTPLSPDESPSPVWIQAASVGEVQVARRVLEEVGKILPGIPVLLSSTTPAGRRLAARSVPEGSRASFFPLDLPATIRRCLRRVRPRALVLVETEIWPNLLRECFLSGVPVILANGRISTRSFPRYRRIRSLVAPALEKVDLYCMQSQEDAERIRALGAPPDRIQVTGNMKWDLPVPDAPAGPVRRDLGLPEEAPVLVAGSTAEGEDEVVLKAWSVLLDDFPDLRLVLAPRHPQRFEKVARLLATRGIPFARRSRGPAGASPVLLLDSVGELRKVYGAGTVCFVGGSLVSRGGQNLMEPAAAGRPVLFGPRTENFADAARSLLEAGAGFRIVDGDSLAAAVRRLLSDSAAREESGRRGRELVSRNCGAAERTAGMIAQILRRPEG